LFTNYHSLAEALQAVFPESPWDATRFVEHTRAPVGFWQDSANIFKALDDAEKKIDITKVRYIVYLLVLLLNSSNPLPNLARGLVFCESHGFEGYWLPFINYQSQVDRIACRKVSHSPMGDQLYPTGEIRAATQTRAKSQSAFSGT